MSRVCVKFEINTILSFPSALILINILCASRKLSLSALVASEWRDDLWNSPIQHCHFPTPLRIHLHPLVPRIVTFREHWISTWHIFLKIDEIGMVAKFAKNADSFERLRFFPFDQSFHFGSLHEVFVECVLEGWERTEDDMFILDGNWAVSVFMHQLGKLEAERERERKKECSRYLLSKSLVLLMMNLLTLTNKSFCAWSPLSFSLSLASPSLPFKIGISNSLWNCCFVPRYPGLQKLGARSIRWDHSVLSRGRVNTWEREKEERENENWPE